MSKGLDPSLFCRPVPCLHFYILTLDCSIFLTSFLPYSQFPRKKIDKLLIIISPTYPYSPLNNDCCYV